MNPFINSITDMVDEMELLISEDELSHEQDDRLQDLFIEIKENLKDAFDYEEEKCRHSDDDRDYFKLKQLKKRFKNCCKEFETPDEIISGTMAMMYPDEDSYDDEYVGERDEDEDD